MRVAVYVPCCNGAAWIEECVGALLTQTRPAAEVVVVDDGSTDRSADIVSGFGRRVRLIQHGRNRGLAVARNTALREVECDVLASVDADVRATPQWLANLIAGFDSPRAGAVGGKLIEAHQERIADQWRAAHMAQHAGDFPLRASPTLAGATMAVRREVVRTLGGYDETLRTNYEDADLRVRLIERGYRCGYVPEAEAHHLRTDTARTVLRTYWGWLRPPAERRGAFASADGLAARRSDVWDRTVRALWTDIADGRSELAYLTLLMGLAFPLADAQYALQFDPALSGIAASWLEALPDALAHHAPHLASCVRDDLAALTWWERHSGGVAGLRGCDPAEALARVPSAWWPRIAAARAALAQSEGWPKVGCIEPEAAPAAASDTIAVIEHGPTQARSVLRITREHRVDATDAELAAHRIGWLPPSPLQQSLLHTGLLVAGEPAALDAIPPWRPESLDPLTALEALTRAEQLLSAGAVEEVRAAAVDALLIARRAYAARAESRDLALRESWPELAAWTGQTTLDYVARARRLVEDWLFTWHGMGPTQPARARWQSLRERARRAARESVA